MSSSNWRDGEIRELLTIMGEKVMQTQRGTLLRAKPRPNRLGSVQRPKEPSRIGPSYPPKLLTMQQNI